MASGLVNAKLLPPLMLSGVVVLAYGVVGTSGAAPRLRLYSDLMFAKDGKPVTISCRDTRGNNIITARWYRDNVEIFQTSYFHPNQILDVNRTASVYERVAVNATLKHHYVILQFNSTLDDRSVWWCRSGKESSYNMTLCSEHTEECTRPNLTMEPQKAEDDYNRDVTSVLWYRNYVYIFQTSTRLPETLQNKQSHKEDYKAVEEGISVKVNSTVHNDILQMNSSLDAESVWTCDDNKKFSNDLVIVTSQTEEWTTLPQQSTPTTDENDAPSKPNTPSMTTQTIKDNFSTDGGDTDTIYIVVGVVGGAVLLAVVVVGIVCMRRRRQAVRYQNDRKEESNVEATPVYQNTISFHTDSSAAVTNPENTQQDDRIVSEDVNTQNMYESLTSVEMHIYRRLK